MFSEQQLLSLDLDTNAYLLYALQLPSFDAEQQRIARCVELVDAELRAAVADNAPDLIGRVAALNGAHSTIDEVQRSIAAARGTLTRLQLVIKQPFQQVQTGVTELRNISLALETMRGVARFFSATAKLKESSSDLARSARLLRDIEDITRHHELAGIDAVEQEMSAVTKASTSIRTKVHELLRSSMAHRNHADLGLAVQCLASLGILSKVVADAVAERKRETLTVIVKQLSSSALQSDDEAALTKIDGALQIIADHANSLTELWKALRRKEASTQRPFVEYLREASIDPAGLLSDYWKATSEHIVQHVHKLTEKNSPMLAMLVAKFALFHRSLSNAAWSLRDFFLAMHLSNIPAGQEATVASDPALNARIQQWLRAVVGTIEARFVQTMADRLREKTMVLCSRIQAAAPHAGAESTIVDINADPKVPGAAAATSAANALDAPTRALLKAFSQEIASNRPDEHALSLALEAMSTSLLQLLGKVKEFTAKVPLPTLPSIAVSVTMGNLFHICVANTLSNVIVELQSALALLPRTYSTNRSASDASAHTASLQGTLREFEAIVKGVVNPFFESATIALSKHVDDLFDVKASATKHVDDRASQLHTRVWHFATRFSMLFDRAAPGLDVAQRNTTVAVASRFLAWSVLDNRRTTRTQAVAELEGLFGVTASLYPLERCGALPRYFRHCARILEMADVPSPNLAVALATRGHPLVVLLALLFRVEPPPIELATALRMPKHELVRVIAKSLADASTKGCAVMWEAAMVTCLADVDVNEEPPAPHLSDVNDSAITPSGGGATSNARVKHAIATLESLLVPHRDENHSSNGSSGNGVMYRPA